MSVDGAPPFLIPCHQFFIKEPVGSAQLSAPSIMHGAALGSPGLGSRFPLPAPEGAGFNHSFSRLRHHPQRLENHPQTLIPAQCCSDTHRPIFLPRLVPAPAPCGQHHPGTASVHGGRVKAISTDFPLHLLSQIHPETAAALLPAGVRDERLGIHF